MGVVLRSSVLVGVVSIIAVLITQEHSEVSLLSDYSAPPPWPIFFAATTLAGMLKAAGDALTPPPVKMMEITFGYHNTMLMHVAQKFEIADKLASASNHSIYLEFHWCVRLAETGVVASDDAECSGEPRTRESLELSIVRIGLETTEFRVDSEMQ